ncbi:hypothetical protein ILYODFUR_027091 [Ilyodon furcidens]|uniref:Uncharacterized protein n=1 Tax=Ilyodon furcidens TaxID=33524 RepID=A0ABV0TPM3_9TELE
MLQTDQQALTACWPQPDQDTGCCAFTNGQRDCRHIILPHSSRLAGRAIWQSCPSRATPDSGLDSVQDPYDRDLVLMLHTSVQAAVSLQKLKAASARDPVLDQHCVFIWVVWPS